MDHRETNHKWYTSFSEETMKFTIENGEGEEIEIPAKFTLCETCHGKGSHVNPSIDSHGLTREDFDNDPDFADDYKAGVYDVSCNECMGRRVSPEPDYEGMDEKLKKYVEEYINDHYEYDRTCRREREMGY